MSGLGENFIMTKVVVRFTSNNFNSKHFSPSSTLRESNESFFKNLNFPGDCDVCQELPGNVLCFYFLRKSQTVHKRVWNVFFNVINFDHSFLELVKTPNHNRERCLIVALNCCAFEVTNRGVFPRPRSIFFQRRNDANVLFLSKRSPRHFTLRNTTQRGKFLFFK